MSDGGILLADIGGTNARFALADPAAPMPLLGDGATTYPEPGRVVQASPGLRNGTPPDGPRRPPRPMMI